MENNSVSELISIGFSQEMKPRNEGDDKIFDMGTPSNYPFLTSESQSFFATSLSQIQGQNLRQNESLYCPYGFPSGYVAPSIVTGFPVLVDNNGVQSEINGGFSDGVCSYKPKGGYGVKNSCFQQWEPWMTKEARSKRMVAMRKSSLASRFGQLNTISSGISFSSGGYTSFAAATGNKNRSKKEIFMFSTPDDKKLKFLMQKELRNSDVSSLGRIVLPKRDAEAYLPTLIEKEGIQLAIREVFSTKVWKMRYRFWPNNKSRMYVLENTGDFVKENGLKSGDFVSLYEDENENIFISAIRLETQPSESLRKEIKEKKECFASLKQPKEKEEYLPPVNRKIRGVRKQVVDGSQEKMLFDGTSSDKKCSKTGNSSSDSITDVDTITQPVTAMVEPWPSKDAVKAGNALHIDNLIGIDFDDCVFNELEMLPSFEECDLSLCDDMMEDLCKGGVDNVLVVKGIS